VKAQRLRFRYRVTPEAAGLGQREFVSAWAEALTAVGLRVAESGGKKPGPLIQLAAPLPQGVTSDGELADVFLDQPVAPAASLAAVQKEMRPGIEILGVEEVGVGGPSLQSQLRWAEYEVRVPANGLSADEVCARIAALLEADSLPSEHQREKKVRVYDLRPLVLGIELEGVEDGAFRVGMRLRAEQEMTARADQTALALQLPEPLSIHRRRLHLDDMPAAISAFRAAGEREA
jgi:radical SAM-linked protein